MSFFRYPGVKPFETAEEHLFFGRGQDVAILYNLILLEKLVVLFGKSGYGKSSLLNAGIIPRFAVAKDGARSGDPGAAYRITPVRFGLHVEGSSLSPLDQVRRRLGEELPGAHSADLLPGEDSLWYFVRRLQPDDSTHFVLLFDQFEEFFSYPADQQQAFKEELAELLYANVPQRIRDRLEGFGEAQRAFLARRLDAKAVFAIRADRLSELDHLRDRLPAILYKRYELRAMTPEQAREAIIRPAALPQGEPPDFLSQSFAYQEQALDAILSELSDTIRAPHDSIEAFQLQILCQYIERAVMEQRISGRDAAGLPLVAKEDLPDIARVYEAYYRSQLDLLDPAERDAARELIEYGLVFIDPQKNEARRLSVDADLLIGQFGPYGVTHELLRRLENTFLVRRETHVPGSFHYELSHDTLLPPVLRARSERESQKQQQAAERRAREAEEKAQVEAQRREEAERLRQEAERGRRRANLFSVIAMALLALAVAAAAFAADQQQKAIIAERTAVTARKRAEAQQQRAQEALDRYVMEKFEGLRQRAYEIMSNGACPVEVFGEMSRLTEEHPGKPGMKEEVDAIRKRMQGLESCK